MTIRKILTLPDPVLRRKSHRITSFDQEFQKLVDDMIETMHDAPGSGLAAPQIGVSGRVFVMEYGDDDDEEAPLKLYVMVNPDIVKVSEEQNTAVEGCLSVPGFAGDVERPSEITVKAFNRYGKPIKYKFTDWKARIFQHENDHLNGVIYTDLANEVWKPSEEEMEEIRD